MSTEFQEMNRSARVCSWPWKPNLARAVKISANLLDLLFFPTPFVR